MTTTLTPLPNLPLDSASTFDPFSVLDKIDIVGETPVGADRPVVYIDHLSGSQIKSLSRCGTAYYFERGLKLPTAKSSSLIKGSAIHDGIAAGLVWKRAQFSAGNSTLDVDAFFDIALASAMATIKKELTPKNEGDPPVAIVWDRRWQKGPLDNVETLEADVTKALHLFAREQYPHLTPIRVEAGYLLRWKDGGVLPVLGYTDLICLDERTGQYWVLDWKTSTKMKSIKDLALDNTLVGYAHGAQVELGVAISRLAYGCIVFNAPEKGTSTPKIRIEIIDIPFYAPRLVRLFSKAKAATNTRLSGEYSLPDDPQTCPSCAFRFVCSQMFGSLDPTLLQLEDDTSAETTDAQPKAAA